MTTDILDLLGSMSSTFNTNTPVAAATAAPSAEANEKDGTARVASQIDLQLNEDKTLKWRGLLNNQFAKKVKNESIPTPTTTTDVDEGAATATAATKPTTDIAAGTADNVKCDEICVQGQSTGGVGAGDDDKNVNGGSNGDHEQDQRDRGEVDALLNDGEQSKPIGRRYGRGKVLKKVQNGEIGPNAPSTVVAGTTTPPGKKRGRKKRTDLDVDGSNTENNDVIETGKVRRSDRNSSAEIKCELDEVKVEEEVDEEKKKRRSVRLVNKFDVEKSSVKEPTIDTDDRKITNIQEILVQSDPTATQRKLEDEKTPKKRGRRAKAASQDKLPQPIEICPVVEEKLPTATAAAAAIPKRSRRRIKPTPKILANDELRYEFETNNIVRITSCSDNVDDSEASTSKSSSHTARESREKVDGAEAVKKKLFSNSKPYSPPPIPPAKPCPDFDEFLNEIRTAKWVVRNQDDKKLNKKQLRKLAKQKEKFFEKLNLQRSLKNELNGSDESLSENEEFVPTTRVQVGKPNVTLRQRMPKESTPMLSMPKDQEQKQPKRKLRTPLDQQHQPKRVRKTVSEEVEARIQAEQPVVEHDEPNLELICYCQQPSQYYTQITLDTSFCCAIDNVDDQKVGCCNELSGELLNLLRPSHSVSYMILCEDHKKRLSAHNCCAGCGIFCTQGNFVLCQHQHFFHSKCAQKYILNSPYDPAHPTTYTSPTLVLKCPHCGVDTPEKSSMVTMKCHSVPIYMDNRKAIVPPAKMVHPPPQISSTSKRKLPKLVSLEGLIPDSVMDIIYGDTGSETLRKFTTKDMFVAVRDGNLEQAALIIASGYDVTRQMPEYYYGTCLHLTAHSGTVQMAYLLLCKDFTEQFLNLLDRELRTAAIYAIMSDKCDILNLFLQSGADMTIRAQDGMTCLHVAAKLGNLEASEMIVDSFKSSKSNHAFSTFLNAQDDGGWTAMVWAAELGYAGIVTLLLNNGADPNICDNDNNTVIHWATLAKHNSDILYILLANGSNCNVQNNHGDTPLHIACRQSKTRICLQLIAKGADLMVKNKVQDLPYDCIPNEQSACARIVGFNMQMKSFGPSGLQNKLICGDISNGRELRPIQMMRNDSSIRSNGSDEDDVDVTILPDFKYISRTVLLQNTVKIDYSISQMRVCNCSDGCCNSDQCQCTAASVQNWYTAEGRLNNEFNFDDPAVIYECNDVCGCNKLICKNRIVQNGIKLPLQVFECNDRTKGWGVRSLMHIPKGSFIAEYTGELLTEMEADNRTDDTYFFELGVDHYCIDANYYGNVSRFFNHSCAPNITAVRVFFDHQDYRFPKIAFFASRDIPAEEEICFDYGHSFWDVKKQYVTCKCLSQFCKYSNKDAIQNNSNKILNEIIEV